jgi:hypothetical protein
MPHTPGWVARRLHPSSVFRAQVHAIGASVYNAAVLGLSLALPSRVLAPPLFRAFGATAGLSWAALVLGSAALLAASSAASKEAETHRFRLSLGLLAVFLGLAFAALCAFYVAIGDAAPALRVLLGGLFVAVFAISAMDALLLVFAAGLHGMSPMQPDRQSGSVFDGS